ncbi:hypothetical protein K7432_017359 [Basidiobolus ranarum]|uniref:Uncharacterized protein n=1 Tax=Basidiobolus ranarum TaxID=34480 RepID=A0ABR2WDI1_9FUNG
MYESCKFDLAFGKAWQFQHDPNTYWRIHEITLTKESKAYQPTPAKVEYNLSQTSQKGDISGSKSWFSQAVKKNQETFLIAVLQDKESKDIPTAITEVLKDYWNVLPE